VQVLCPLGQGDILKTGDNTINIKVTAEDGITTKIYILTVHRQTAEEDEKMAAEESNNEKELELAYEQANAERLSETEQVQSKTNWWKVALAALAATAAAAVAGAVVIVKKKM